MIGSTISIKGDLSGEEDLLIEGRVEGKIELRRHSVTVGKNGHVKADIYGKSINIDGQTVRFDRRRVRERERVRLVHRLVVLHVHDRAARVAATRGEDVDDVLTLVDAHTEDPDLGFLGERRVNVLELNVALDARR